MRCPDCPGLRGNQHGTWLHMCETHDSQFRLAAMLKGVSPEELLEEAMDFYMGRHHPDAKRWLA